MQLGQLLDLGFPPGDGSQVLPPASVFAACSAEQRPAAAAGAVAAGGDGAQTEAASGERASFAGAGDGLWQRLHAIYFRDANKTLARCVAGAFWFLTKWCCEESVLMHEVAVKAFP